MKSLVLTLCLLSLPASAQTLTGTPAILDGATLALARQEIRLYGIIPQKEATKALADRIGSADISCDIQSEDPQGRAISVCHLGSLDLNGWLVEQGWALADRQTSATYTYQEDLARRFGRGLWASYLRN
ncbi:thermonuclease family protein [Lacibacterium aquatile]|uniref:Thermonuclease family protein n=1 Tax=Lacibacterium aquatile TaxID=1168082 RepID=A0ABW5DVP3_9PROT